MTAPAGARAPVSGAAWVCLMYHDIADGSSTAGGGPEFFNVSATEFARQLGQLVDEGYRGCTLAEAMLGAAGARRVAITFDDGNAGQFERGFRALIRHGCSATFFVTTAWVGRPGYVSWTQLREMSAGGMSVQAHGNSHRFLSELDPSDLATELGGAKDILDTQLAQHTDTLALPGGDWPRRALRHMIAAAGYRVVATSRWGTNRIVAAEGVPYATVRRCTVRGTPGPVMFRRILAGDPWLARRRWLRERPLAVIRGTLGASRYAAWRRALLDAWS